MQRPTRLLVLVRVNRVMIALVPARMTTGTRARGGVIYRIMVGINPLAALREVVTVMVKIWDRSPLGSLRAPREQKLLFGT